MTRFFSIPFIALFIFCLLLINTKTWASKPLPPICENIDSFLSQEISEASPSLKADSILVDKSNRVLYLFNNNELIYRFNNIDLGIEPVGPKEIEGDYKTPEGSYSIKNKKRSSKYLISLEISYPNKYDIEFAQSLEKEPGSAIMIHGLPQDKQSYEFEVATDLNDWTRGCIALTDEEIKILDQKVNINTPIDICP